MAFRAVLLIGTKCYLAAMEKVSKKTASLRGLKLNCPKCNDAPLFKAYLKPIESCASCGHNWSEVRADDGPAWATMLVVLHLLAPFFHFIGIKSDMPMWASSLILCSLGLGLSLLLLPRMKGLFIGLVWTTGAPTSIDKSDLT